MSEGLEFIHTLWDDDRIKTSTRLARSESIQTSEFVFVNWDYEGDEEQKKSSRKLIRSKATAYSHRVAPRGVFRPEQSVRSDSDSRRQSLASSDKATPTLSRSNSSVGLLKRGRDESEPTAEADSHIVKANIARKRTSRRPRPKREGSPSGSSDRSVSPGPLDIALPMSTLMDASNRDPFMTYPVRYRQWYGQLISYWYNVVLPRSTRVIKASPQDLRAYTMWSRRQEISEPVLFYTSLFLATGIPVAEGMFPVRAALWLRQKTVQTMQEALADPERALSIPVILAVGRIALHEHIYGNRELAHTMHRPAQLRMVNMRGGLANLGLPATTIQLIVWTDALMSAETGTTPYFADVPRQMARIHSYTPEEAMYVTNFSSPRRTAHPGYDKQPIPVRTRAGE